MGTAVEDKAKNIKNKKKKYHRERVLQCDFEGDMGKKNNALNYMIGDAFNPFAARVFFCAFFFTCSKNLFRTDD